MKIFQNRKRKSLKAHKQMIRVILKKYKENTMNSTKRRVRKKYMISQKIKSGSTHSENKEKHKIK